jgi:hypothetical protein
MGTKSDLGQVTRGHEVQLPVFLALLTLGNPLPSITALRVVMLLFTGITTVLTMTFLGLEARTDLPKVPYPTALDFFVFLSFAFIFATIIQVRGLCFEQRSLYISYRTRSTYPRMFQTNVTTQNRLSSRADSLVHHMRLLW